MLACFLSVSYFAHAFKLPDTGQSKTYDNTGEISPVSPGQRFFGQDASYAGSIPAYKDNGDGTVTDLVTGLMWSKSVDLQKSVLSEAQAAASRLSLAGYHDWRVPDIKELYSLIDFRGYTGSADDKYAGIPDDAIPFINTDFFDFAYGDLSAGERYIDAQWLSSTKYVSTTMHGAETLFGVNFADGRIKGYGLTKRDGSTKKFYVRFVRGQPYGNNDFSDNGDGTVADAVTGLTWMKADSGRPMSWEEALAYAEGLSLAGFDDWRLPDAKELQYIVDYTRSPDTTDSPAIAPVFETSSIINEAGRRDYPCFWTSTTHLDGHEPGKAAAYVAFGRALGKMHGAVMDVHGAGAQRSDPKTGTPTFRGPQGDAVRITNYVRCVRGGDRKLLTAFTAPSKQSYPFKIKLVGRAGVSVKTSQGVSSKRHHQNDWKGNGRMPDKGGFRHHFINRLDSDGDGRVSRSEFDGPVDRFDYHDRNRDGFIEASEAPTGPPPGRRP